MNIPFGVLKMSGTIEGLVETSNNIGILKTEDSEVLAVSSVRSSVAVSYTHLGAYGTYGGSGKAALRRVSGASGKTGSDLLQTGSFNKMCIRDRAKINRYPNLSACFGNIIKNRSKSTAFKNFIRYFFNLLNGLLFRREKK